MTETAQKGPEVSEGNGNGQPPGIAPGTLIAAMGFMASVVGAMIFALYLQIGQLQEEVRAAQTSLTELREYATENRSLLRINSLEQYNLCERVRREVQELALCRWPELVEPH